MLEVTCNDRLGKKVRVKCNGDDTIGDLKKLIAAQTGTRWDKIVLKKWYTIFKDHIKLQDCVFKKEPPGSSGCPRNDDNTGRTSLFFLVNMIRSVLDLPNVMMKITTELFRVGDLSL
uniref:Ubiquitin-like protein 5 n=1 Tax=Timema douglasi TaxID=61478 RepID=A0A7R8VQH6_TIMDO|nr:unnamed protein product [Timema douglasi]